MLSLSIIIPVLNEASNIGATLSEIAEKSDAEIIVVDGGSVDNTVELARQFPCKLLSATSSGRAAQMNLGAKHATGSILLFLHADTILPDHFSQTIDSALDSDEKVWGRFDVSLSGKKPVFRLIAFMMNMRSRLTGIATGDQAIFVKRKTFLSVGGFEEIPLMEDIALSQRLKKMSQPVCLKEKVKTSSRRWEKNGVWKTIFLMWQLRLAYFFGVSPAALVKKYY